MKNGTNDGTPGHRIGELQGTKEIWVLDTYGLCLFLPHFSTKTKLLLPHIGVKRIHANFFAGDANVTAAFVRQGIIPTAAFEISVGISTQLLELFRCLQLRCPRLGNEPLLKALADMQGVVYRPYHAQQLAIAYDLYLELRELVRKRVDGVLERSDPMWRIKNTCPACTYSLKGEEKLIFNMLMTMDGNNSLKRVLSKGQRSGAVSTTCVDRTDSQTIGKDYYLSREKVDSWAAGVVHDGLAKAIGEVNSCESRWKNMVNDITSKMWAIFDETGVFLALCRHGFVLVIVDMVRSGELAKYGLAVVDALLEAFGSDIGSGYDIGCKFRTTIANSALGAKAQRLNFRSLVGAFHGHAHGRKCQLQNLATYVLGLGLEDLEGCERFFSRSNALSSSIRYASVFHRKQRIVTYLRHTDTFETYANLSKFLVDNYKQALNILGGEDAFTVTAMAHGIANISTIEGWLVDERKYLDGLSTEPPTDTYEMEYLKRLQDYYHWSSTVSKAREKWAIATPSNMNQQMARQWAQQERQLRHALEMEDKALLSVQESERRLEISPRLRWEPNSLDWNRVSEMVSLRDYRRAVDSLESLVVSRIFELTKMNMSDTGYHLRTQIAKALQARSQAIKTAIDKYNKIARTMKPPRDTLSWDEVVEYTFISDFDLLRDARQDVRLQPWATATSRKLLDQYFKIQRAKEERKRLDIEIRRVITYIQDENKFLVAKEAEVKLTNPALAHQIALRRNERSRFDQTHLRRFQTLLKMPGFTGTLIPGLRDGRDNVEGSQPDNGISMLSGQDARVHELPGNPNRDDDEDDDLDDDGDNEEGSYSEKAAYEVLRLAGDSNEREFE
ncbi:hypothetical protein BDN72DRAFT_781218 [Pluteus cervinus]|uniref:Uncharacterized protein n=1 Tax=Pluteus cervinus TaxID=181527 RepID=A0ACD3A076_9AGAR|nr:hypothetical protein BDN72DRAFT_781218 [Pluteus cervinus]